MTSRRGRRVEAHRRWQSVSSLGGPGGLSVAATAAAAGPQAASTSAGLHDKEDDRFDGGGDDRRPLSATDASNASGGARGVRGGDGAGIDGRCDRQHDGAPRKQQCVVAAAENDVIDDSYPEIPTEDIGVFMTTLVEGMKSDGMQLANSAKNVMANTFQVNQRRRRGETCGAHARSTF